MRSLRGMASYLMRWVKRILLLLACAAPLHAAELRDLEQQVARNPADARALYRLGLAAFRANDFAKAHAAFTTLKGWCDEKRLPSDHCIRIFYNAGNTDYKRGEYREALADFEAVLARDPGHEKAREKRDFIKKLLEQEKQKQKNDDKKKDRQDKEKKQQEQNRDPKDDESKKEQQRGEQQKQEKKEQQGDQQGQKNEKQQQQGGDSERDQEQESRKNGEQKGDEQQRDGEQRGQDQQRGGEGQETKKQEQQQPGAQGQENKAKGKRGESVEERGEAEKQPLTEQQRELLALAQNLDNRAHQQLVRQQAGMRARVGGQHEW
ncbi:MAG: tetratricopeptide repeat protein [Candidatus Dependentiae bacterium]|nr:tetratricopeptide repeat protein [Candidatus Dependentiae bacterium]